MGLFPFAALVASCANGVAQRSCVRGRRKILGTKEDREREREIEGGDSGAVGMSHLAWKT